MSSSPFADASATLRPPSPAASFLRGILAALAGLLLLAALVAGGFYLRNRVSDPFRTLPTLPLAQYYRDGPASLEGNTYRLSAKIEADLGYSESEGRLLLFRDPDAPAGSTADTLTVLLPPALARQPFDKGQTYLLQIEVLPGGLIRAANLRKE